VGGERAGGGGRMVSNRPYDWSVKRAKYRPLSERTGWQIVDGSWKGGRKWEKDPERGRKGVWARGNFEHQLDERVRGGNTSRPTDRTELWT